MTGVGTSTNGLGDAPTLAALDIGTNSFHLVVARPVGDNGFEVLTREKETIRLGHGARDMKRLAPDAMDRGVACLARLARIAHSHNATLRAVATSAVREADNADEFIARARDEADVAIDVISGVEEARLIHLGVLQAVPAYDKRVLTIDIGGGSTEILLGNGPEVIAARSFKLGAVRLTDRYFPDGTIRGDAISTCRSDIAGTISHLGADVAEHGFDIAIVSSGTAETIARMVDATTAGDSLHTYNCFEFTADDLRSVTKELCRHKTARQRRHVDGLEPGRADIIVAGTLILDVIAERFGVERFTFSENALREGVLLDTINRFGGRLHPAGRHRQLRDVSRRSVRQLAARCDEDPVHSAHVANLALGLFDQLQSLHELDPLSRDHLEAASLLANVGLVVAHSKHHLHSYYVIRNSELTGFTDAEIEIIALIARYHRKSRPKPSHEPYSSLELPEQQKVRLLAGVLRVAIGLDRSYDQRVRDLRVNVDEEVITIAVDAGDDVDLELHAATQRSELLADELGRRIDLVRAG